MSPVFVIFRREFGSYFATPLAAAFLVIFLLLTGAFTFYLGEFYEIGQADLQVFFRFHPWLYLLLVPAVAMRLWAEERKAGTLDEPRQFGAPMMAIFTCDKQPFHEIPAALPTFERLPQQ